MDLRGDVPVDLSRNRRHDFYVYKKLTLPRTLGPGRYVLKVTIVDQQSQRVAENSMTVNLMGSSRDQGVKGSGLSRP